MNDENENNNLHSLQDMDGAPDAGEDSVSLETGRPAVASAPTKIMVFLIVGLACIIIVVKSLFFSGAAPVAENQGKKRPERVVTTANNRPVNMSSGELPVPPQPDPITNYTSNDPSKSAANMPSGPDLSKLPPPPGNPNTVNLGGLPPITMNNPTTLNSGAPQIKAPDVTFPGMANPPPPLISATPPAITASPGITAVPPPPPPGIIPPPMPDVKTSLPKDEKALKRIQAESVVVGGGAAANNPKNTAAKTKTATGFAGGTDANSQFANSVTAASHNDSTSAERIDNLEYTIIQGKIVHAVLESAINSDLPGTLRAVTSHDVYAEAGRAILIPKGSRLLGTYNSAVKRGQARVFIIWTRVIRPDGVTIDVDSPAVDNLGRAGLYGDVDNKYVEMFSTALLTSSFDIGLAAIGQALFGDDQTTTTTNQGTGGSTTTSSPTAEAMQQAVANIGTVGKQIVGNTLSLSPTITVDQGTPVNIFVNKELVFPPSVTGGLISIQ